MAKAEKIYHQDLGAIMDTCGLVTAGENVADGYPTGRSVVNQGWMRSDGHRANILSRELQAGRGRRAPRRLRHLVRRAGVRPALITAGRGEPRLVTRPGDPR